MSPMTEKSRPQYASPSPVKMKLFQQPVPGNKTPSFIPSPSKKLENGLKTEDINTPMQNSELSRTPQLSEFEKVQIQQQEVQDIARANLQRVHIFLAKYNEFSDQLAEIEKRTFKDEIVKSFNKPDQKQF